MIPDGSRWPISPDASRVVICAVDDRAGGIS
jgi:hypothetical protein